MNSWIKSTSGYWEEPYWSLGILPAIEQAAIMLTNRGFKALAIGSGTTANYADSLRIRNFTVDAPANSGNLLLLNYAGLTVPLDVTDWFTIGTNGSLLSLYSALDGDFLHVSGKATFAEFGQTRFGSVYLTNSAELLLSNGWFQSANEFVSGPAAKWEQFGGSNRVGFMEVQAGGTYNLRDGVLSFTGKSRLQVGSGPGLAIFGVAGGLADLAKVVIGSQPPDQRGEIRIAGGLFRSPHLLGLRGQMIQTGGTNQTDRLTFPGEIFEGDAGYSLHDGRLETREVALGEVSLPGIHSGTIAQLGGLHTNSGGISLVGEVRDGSPMRLGNYTFFGGSLVSPGISVDGGSFFQDGGTSRTHTITITHVGRLQLSRGLLSSTNTRVEFSVGVHQPFFNLQGGEHHVGSLLVDSAGVYDFQSGLLSADTITLEAQGELRLWRPGVVSTNEFVLMRGGGRLFTQGNHELGSLRVSGDSTITFASEPTILRFRDAGHTNGALDAFLYIRNWSGSAQAPGTNQLYVGNNPQAITPSQLRLIIFVDPAGYAPGNYRARVKSTGEIVPLEPGTITFRREENSLVLTWPEGYQLFSAAVVDGPYMPVEGATSPYTVFFTEPQRFFIVRPAQ